MSPYPSVLELETESLYFRTSALGPEGTLPLNRDLLLHSPSGDLFGLTQGAGMGWDPAALLQPQLLILSTSGGLRADDGSPIALGYHTGHWELNLLVREAALEMRQRGRIPFAAFCSDPCDGRSQGTPGMMDSLPYRNTAAEAFGRLIRSLPRREGVMGIATCDKGLPAMMMALAEARELPCILVPGGVTLPAEGSEDAGTVQSIGARYSHGELTLEEAALLGCRACGTAGGGCQFLGTAASSQVIAEALGISLPHSALIPSGEPIWLSLARRSARALELLCAQSIKMQDILTPKALHNAMVVHAAFGGSTNLLLHLPAIAHCAGLPVPSVQDWQRVNAAVPRLVDVLPNGPRHFKTVQVFAAGGVADVMLHLRELGLLELDALTVTGRTVAENLDWWAESKERSRSHATLKKNDAIDPADVILAPARARDAGLARTVIFPRGNLAPEGSVVKSSAIDASLCPDERYHFIGSARVFTSEDSAIAAIKSHGADALKPGEVIVLICRGPFAAGMPETSQITMALKYTKALKNIPLITDGRFSGFSSGPCIGHVGPEALSGGPIGKIRDGDIIEILLDRRTMEGSIDLVGDASTPAPLRSAARGSEILGDRPTREDLSMDPRLPAATRLWAALQAKSGGTWAGCVYDVDRIVSALSR